MGKLRARRLLPPQIADLGEKGASMYNTFTEGDGGGEKYPKEYFDKGELKIPEKFRHVWKHSDVCVSSPEVPSAPHAFIELFSASG